MTTWIWVMIGVAALVTVICGLILAYVYGIFGKPVAVRMPHTHKPSSPDAILNQPIEGGYMRPLPEWLDRP